MSLLVTNNEHDVDTILADETLANLLGLAQQSIAET
jgi:hypothetical protein